MQGCVCTNFSHLRSTLTIRWTLMNQALIMWYVSKIERVTGQECSQELHKLVWRVRFVCGCKFLQTTLASNINKQHRTIEIQVSKGNDSINKGQSFPTIGTVLLYYCMILYLEGYELASNRTHHWDHVFALMILLFVYTSRNRSVKAITNTNPRHGFAGQDILVGCKADSRVNVEIFCF